MRQDRRDLGCPLLFHSEGCFFAGPTDDGALIFGIGNVVYGRWGWFSKNDMGTAVKSLVTNV